MYMLKLDDITGPMGNTLGILLILLLVCSFGTAAGGWVEGELKTFTLNLGCELDWIGWVDLNIERQELVVNFSAVTWDPDVWLFNETQLYLGSSAPTSCDHDTFPWKHDLQGTLTDEYRIELEDLDLGCGETLYFAARAVISGRETWGFDENCTKISEEFPCAKYCAVDLPCEDDTLIEDWPMFSHDIHHTGYTSEPGPTKNYTLWTYDTGNNVFSSPTIAIGRVFFGSRDGHFYCLNATSGAQLWNYLIAKTVHSPAVDGGRVYVGSSDFRVYCFDAITGSLVWDTRTGYYVNAPPAVHEGRVYIGSWDYHFYCLDASTGTMLWRFEAKDNFEDSAAAVRDGRVYVGCTDRRLLCLDASTGGLLWQFETGGGIHSSPALYGDYVYFGSMDGNVYCLDAIGGAQVWNHSTGNTVLASPAVAYDRVFIGSSDRVFYCLNATTGTSIWEYNARGEITSSPALTNETVYFGSTDGRVHCLDTKTGCFIWEYETGDTIYSSPAVADGRAYIGSFDDMLYAFGSQSFGFATDTGEFVSVESNSVVGGFYFNDSDREFGFASSGDEGTTAFANITFPSGMLGETPLVYEDDKPITPVVTQNATHTAIYIEYVNGRHDVRVATVPEVIFVYIMMGALLGSTASRADNQDKPTVYP
jgi:outer membrane protein assembly factor BamB